jgi:hypothetical protein
MSDISEILKSSGIEIPEEKREAFLKEFRTSYKSVAELDKLREKKDSLETRINELNDVVSGYKKIDVDGLKEELNSWKEKYENVDKEYAKKINKQILTNAFNKFKFSSNTAKSGIFNTALNSDKIKFENDTVVGLDEFMKSMKEQDPQAFIEEEEKKDSPKYSRSISNASKEVFGDPSNMDFNTYKKWRKSK